MFKSVTAVSFFFLVVTMAHAQAPCRDDAWVLREVERLLGRPAGTLVPSDLPFRIEAQSSSPDHFHLVLTQGTATRHLESDSCEEVYRAAALVAAVAIDPSFQPPQDVPPSAPQESPTPPQSEVALEPRPEPPRSPEAPSSRTEALRFGVEMSVLGQWGPQPGLALLTGIGGFVQIGQIRLGLAGQGAAPSTQDVDFGGVQIWSWGGALYGSWQLELAEQWFLGVGAQLEAGEYRAEGRRAMGVTAASTAFIRAGLRLTFEWYLTESVALSLFATAGPTILRPKFLINSRVVFQTEPLFVAGGLQLSWFF